MSKARTRAAPARERARQVVVAGTIWVAGRRDSTPATSGVKTSCVSTLAVLRAGEAQEDTSTSTSMSAGS